MSNSTRYAKPRPRQWSPPRVCRQCGQVVFFPITGRRSLRVMSHVGTNGERSPCPGSEVRRDK